MVMMNLRIRHYLSIVMIAAICGSKPADAAVIYLDDFNRTNSTTLGTTSTGGFAWVESKLDSNTSANADLEISNNLLRIVSSSGNHDTANAFVDGVGADLNSVQQYSIAFSYQHTAEAVSSSGNAGIFILPRAESTDFIGNSGWVFRGDSSTTFSVHSYSGGARSGGHLGSVLSTSLGSFTAGTPFNILIQVDGDTASLTIGSTLVQSGVSLGSNYNNANHDHLMVGYNALGTSGRAVSATIDNLEVTAIPEPSTLLLGAAAVGFLLLKRWRTA
jgi:hypothetical protein